MIPSQLGFMNKKINAWPGDKGHLRRTKEPEAILGPCPAVRRATLRCVFLPRSTLKRGFRSDEAQLQRHGLELLRKKTPRNAENPARQLNDTQGGRRKLRTRPALFPSQTYPPPRNWFGASV